MISAKYDYMLLDTNNNFCQFVKMLLLDLRHFVIENAIYAMQQTIQNQYSPVTNEALTW